MDGHSREYSLVVLLGHLTELDRGSSGLGEGETDFGGYRIRVVASRRPRELEERQRMTLSRATESEAEATEVKTVTEESV